MNFRFRLCLATVAIAIGLMYFAPVSLAQQQQRPTPPPSEVTPPQTPSETPVTGEQGTLRQNQSDSNTSDSNTALPVAPENYAGDSHSISWGSLIFGLIVGGAIGYLAGRKPKQVDVPHDRAA